MVPSSNTTVEVEFFLALRESIRKQLLSLHFARLPLDRVTLPALEEMERKSVESARELASADVDLIAYACTSGSLFKGLGHDTELSRLISQNVGIDTVTTATAVVETLKGLGVSKISVGTPYVSEVNRAEEEFLSQNGFEVVDVKGLGLKDNTQIGRLSPAEVFRLACSLSYDHSDAIFLSCTNMPSFTVIDTVQHETGKPVVSSNSSTLRSALGRLGLSREEIAHQGIPGLLETTQIAQ